MGHARHMKALLGWVLFWGAIWLFWESMPFAGEVTVYNGFCPKPRVNGKCAAGEETANPTTYKASAELQAVVYWSANGPPRKYEKCVVRDAKNWTCPALETDGTSNAEYRMIDGEFRPSGFSFDSPFYQVPKWEYYLIKLNKRGDK